MGWRPFDVWQCKREQLMTIIQTRLLRRSTIAAVWVSIWAFASLFSRAADDTQSFVEGLRQQRYFDTAAGYLQHRADDPNLSADVKTVIPYQQAVVLIEEADHTADLPARDQARNEAQTKLQEFLAANPDHELAPQARDRLGNLLLEIGDGILAQAKKWGGDQTKQHRQAQSKYADARAVFDDSARRFRSQLDKLPPGEQREELGPQWLGASVNVGRATFQMALAAEAGSDQQKQLLTDAAAQCGSLYQKYSKRLGGAVAHFYEGRCYEELGERKQALTAYTDLIVDVPDTDAAFRPLKTQAVKRAQQLWLQNQDFKAVADTVAWAKGARGAELQDPDWLAIKLSAATGLKGLIAATPKKDSKINSYLHDARDLATDVLKSKDSELQALARDLLTQLERGGELAQSTPPTSAKTSSARPAASRHEVLQLAADTRAAPATAVPDGKTTTDATSFDELYDKASFATDDVKSAQTELEFSRQGENPDTKHIADVEADLKVKREEAMTACQQAIALPSAAANIEKLNQLRYWLCWFHYAKGDYYDAAVLGDVLARKYPKSASALAGAQVALASFDAIYRQRKQAGQNNNSFAVGQLDSVANYVMKRWPNEPAAAAALETLIRFAIDEGDYDKARKIIEQTPADSLARISGEAKLGQSLWAKYLRTMQQIHEQKAAAAGDKTAATSSGASTPTADDPQTKRNLDAMLKQAEQSLQVGIDGLRKQDMVDERAVLAALSLSQLELNAGHADKAVALLEDPKIGPLALLRANAPVTQVEGVPAEIYKTAIRAYVAVEPQQLENAIAAMDALEKLYASDPDGATRLTQMLVGVAYDLEQQLDELNRQGDTEKSASITNAFEKFLGKIAESETSVDYRTLNWVAATYESLANGLIPGASAQTNTFSAATNISHHAEKLSPDVKRYLQQAAKAYEAILARAKDHPDEVSADKLPAIKRRLALDYRSLGDYEKSIAKFVDVLKEKPTLLPVQIEAAYAYQMRGENENPDYFVGAMLGGRGPAESIWGWNQISQKTARDERFRDVFHEARYNMALCRVEFAASRTNADEKQKLLELANGTIRETKRYEGTMGGAKWKPQYEKLLREIQKDLGEPVVGLLEFDQQEAERGAAQSASDKK
jgi:cellulose synthase operon protein C